MRLRKIYDDLADWAKLNPCTHIVVYTNSPLALINNKKRLLHFMLSFVTLVYFIAPSTYQFLKFTYYISSFMLY